MKKWEYKRVDITEEPPSQDYLNSEAVGAKGWDVIQVVTHEGLVQRDGAHVHVPIFVVYLKRPC